MMNYRGFEIAVVDNGHEMKDPKDGQSYKVTHGNMVNDGRGKIYMTEPDYQNLKRKFTESATP